MGPQPMPTKQRAKHDNAKSVDSPIIIEPVADIIVENDINLPGLKTLDKIPPIGCITAYVQKYIELKMEITFDVLFYIICRFFIKKLNCNFKTMK